MKIAERFERRYIPEPNSGCWLWLSVPPTAVYGRFKIGGGQIGAHVASWRLHRGPVPPGLCVCHKCDVPTCVNPDHLFVGTHADNTADAKRKGRLRHYVNPGVAVIRKLTVEQRRHIRSSHEPGVDLAERFGVSSAAITYIRSRRSRCV